MPSRGGPVGIDPKKLKVAVRHLDEQLGIARENTKHLQERDAKFDELRGVLEGLPEKIEHPVMVPFGPLAFFEGSLVHTNEVLVQLSSEWFAMKTAKASLGTVERRKVRLRREMEDIGREVHDLQERRRVAVGEGAACGMNLGGEHPEGEDGLLDIREPFYEEDAPRVEAGGVQGATVTRDADGYFDIREPADAADVDPAPLPAAMSADAGSSEPDGPNMARLRELERLEAQDEMDELDDLLESYENTGSAPGAAASEPKKRVSFSDAPPSEAPAPGGAASGAEFRSPADIYRFMSSAVEEELPLKPALKPSLVPPPEPDFSRPLGQAGEKAFTGTVRESLGALSQSQADGAVPAPKRLSKFKAQRQAAGY